MIIGGVIAAVLIGGAFYGGMMYQQNTTPARGAFGMMNGTFTGQMGRTGLNGTRSMGAGVTAGEILSKDANSITLKLQDGSTRIVFTNASTTVMKTSEGALTDLSVGTAVTAIGTTNSDGSVTAQSVQLRPAGSQSYGVGR